MLTDAERKSYREDLQHEVSQMKYYDGLHRRAIKKALELHDQAVQRAKEQYHERVQRANSAFGTQFEDAQNRYFNLLDKVQEKERESESKR